jgi:hypothetical protein
VGAKCSPRTQTDKAARASAAAQAGAGRWRRGAAATWRGGGRAASADAALILSRTSTARPAPRAAAARRSRALTPPRIRSLAASSALPPRLAEEIMMQLRADKRGPRTDGLEPVDRSAADGAAPGRQEEETERGGGADSQSVRSSRLKTARMRTRQPLLQRRRRRPVAPLPPAPPRLPARRLVALAASSSCQGSAE